MPTPRQYAQVAAAIFGLISNDAVAGHVKGCPKHPPLSCSFSNTTVADTCCTNVPGGLLLQTQFWDYKPATGPTNSWTVHGLWPDNCDGTYQQYCDANREYTNITQILQSYKQKHLLSYMNEYWKDYQGNDESFWEHEWDKHGTCISTLDPPCYVKYTPQEEVVDYFNRAVSLFKTLPSYKFLKRAGIVPSSTATYKLSAVQAALEKGHGHVPTIQCDNAGSINEIWYYYHTRGTVAEGQFVSAAATTPGDCPAVVKYLPKIAGSSPTATSAAPTATGTSTSNPTSTGSPAGSFSGNGFINVNQAGKQNGCLISAGTWYTTGTCATYSAAASAEGFTLTSSKGKCAVDDSNKLSCGSAVSDATVFDADGKSLTYNGSSGFYSNAVAAGSTQEPVYAGSGSVELSLTWQSV